MEKYSDQLSDMVDLIMACTKLLGARHGAYSAELMACTLRSTIYSTTKRLAALAKPINDALNAECSTSADEQLDDVVNIFQMLQRLCERNRIMCGIQAEHMEQLQFDFFPAGDA